jgi:S1-C subfamily serine protease
MMDKTRTTRGWEFLLLLLLSACSSHLASFEDTLDLVRPAVVQIRTSCDDDRPGGRVLGSGFIVSRGGHIVTANHVVEGAEGCELKAGLAIPPLDGGDLSIRGSFFGVHLHLIACDPLHDVALLQMSPNPFDGATPYFAFPEGVGVAKPAVARFTEDPPRDGTPIALTGYPFALPVPVSTSGRIASSSTYDTVPVNPVGAPPWFVIPEVLDFALADLEANPGNSGGPVFMTASGAVVGLCHAYLSAQVNRQSEEGVDRTYEGLRYGTGLTVVVPVKYIIPLL